MSANKIVVAGATGNLGGRIVKAFVEKNADVFVIVRTNSDPEKVTYLKTLGATVHAVDQWTIVLLQPVCTGAACVVSALAGLQDVVIDAQKVLLDAAIAAGVPRFIPSDYSLDFTKFSPGENRNLDLRREFHRYLDRQSIKSTTIFNGAFMDMLLKEMPLIFTDKGLIVYFGKTDHRMTFTTMDNTAKYTAAAALDNSAPRYLHIAGDQKNPREIKKAATEVFGKKFRLIRPGGQNLLGFLIKMARFFSPGKHDLYPAWQGMQYMHNMIDTRADVLVTDNDRYPGIHWTTVKELLEESKSE